MEKEFLVLDWEIIENNLSQKELDLFYDLLNKITEYELEEDDYCVIRKSYLRKIELEEIEQKEKKKELFKHLEELSNLKDKSVAHAEADEILINFISNKDIEKLYDKIIKYC